jgi:peroxiredoxin
MALKIGAQAPDFTLPNQNGTPVALKSLLGKGPVLIAFYPGDFTSVCTDEMVCFRQDFSEFQNLNCTIVGISCDDVKSHKDFVEKYRFPFDLLADVDASVAKAYGAKLPLINKANRAIFILDGTGKVGYAHVETLPVFKRTNKELLDAVRAVREG